MAVHRAAAAKGFAPDFVDGCLEAIAVDVSRTFDKLTLRPPDHPERRASLTVAEGLGLVEVICEDQIAEVVIISLRVEAFE